MRVVVCAVLYGRGGTETHLLHLCKELVDRGHDVVLACRYADRSTPLVQQHKQLGVTRLVTPFDGQHRFYKWSTIFAVIAWPFYLARKRPDIILTLERSRFLHFLRFFLHARGKVILMRAGLPAHTSEYMPLDILNILDGAITESPLQSQASLNVFPELPTQSIPLLGNISDSIKLRSPFTKGHNEELRIAFMGRYDVKKGIFRLLDLWPLIKSDHVRLDFYGHGAEKYRLIDQIKERGLENQVSVHDGWTTPAELGRIMTDIDILVLPSEEEGLPVILMESMAYGVPFVATDVGAVRTYAENNPDVCVVPLDNGAFARAIDELVSAIRSRAINGQRLQSYYNEHYAFSELANNWVEALESASTWTE